MRPAAQWLDMLEKRHFVLTEEYIKAIQRDALESAARRLHDFQDIVSWQPGESRNVFVGDLEQAIRAMKPER